MDIRIARTAMRGDLWTDYDKQTASDLWRQGYSARVIGDKMGRTRRSIIGLVNRLGLLRTKRPANPAPYRQRNHNQYTGRKPIKAVLGHKRSDGSEISLKSMPMPVPTVAAKTGYRRDGKLIDMMELRLGNCHWPVGDPLLDGFGYCGARTEGTCPYCVIHKRVAYYRPAR